LRATKHPSPLRRTAGIVAVLFLFALVGGQSAIADTKSELDAQKAELNKILDAIEGNQAKVDKLNGEISELAAAQDKVQSDIARTEAEIARLQGQIEKANEELVGLQEQLDHRAWVAYQSGPASSFEFLLGSTSLADFSTRLEIVNRAAESDRNLINEVQDKRADLETKELSQQRARTRLIGQGKELQRQQEAVFAKLDEAKAVSDELASQKAQADRMLKKLKAKLAAEEAARLAALTGGGGGGGGAVAGSPFKVCPVAGPHGYSDDFGAPRYGGGYHLHAGNDLFASLGTPVVAPFSGTAANASNGLGGISVKVFGPAGWVYNAHLSAIGRLGSVSAGDVIGYVGNTGDAAGTPYHDHFEWHPNVIPANAWTSPYGVSQVGSAIDPYPYLNQVC
jgi:peptidoglycan hydrolase CwlO-like protein